jgi:hypothetical protein
MAISISHSNNSNPLRNWLTNYVLSTTRGFSVGGWANVINTSSATYQCFMSKGDGGTHRPFFVGLNTTPTFNFLAANGGVAGNTSITTVAGIVAGDWYYVLAVFVGNSITLYVYHYPAAGGPGVLLANNAPSPGTSDADAASYTTWLGSDPSGGLAANGYLHNWIVWDCALTSVEAQAIGSGAVNPMTVRLPSQAVRASLNTPLINQSLFTMGLNQGWAAAHFWEGNNSIPMMNVPNPPATGSQGLFYGSGYPNIPQNNGLGGIGVGNLASPLLPFPSLLSAPPPPAPPAGLGIVKPQESVLQRGHPLAQGMVLAYCFDEMVNPGLGLTAGELTDKISLTPTTSTAGVPAWITPGTPSTNPGTVAGGAITIPLGAQIDTNRLSVVEGLKQITVISRCNLYNTNGQSGGWLLSKGNTPDLGLSNLTDGKTYFYFNGTAITSAVGAVPGVTWGTLAATYDGTTQLLFWIPYSGSISGFAGQIASGALANATMPTTGTHLLIGDSGGANCDYAIDCMMIYNRALSPQEIAQWSFDPFVMFRQRSFNIDFKSKPSAVFRKTFSQIGGRIGSRQPIGWGA